MEAKSPPITSPQLAKACAHPIRIRALAILVRRPASPRELSEEMSEALNTVAYHVKVLKDLACIELVNVVDAHGGRVSESFYRATQRPSLSVELWNSLSEREQHGLTTTIMRMISEDVDKAMNQGTFLDPSDNHLSRVPMTVDREGWSETIVILDRAVEELLEVEKQAAVRMEGKASGEMFQKVEIIHFRSPDRD